ncbi:MAG TPA: hypothetical protein VG496_03205, partial [Myxococcales bacterium]|nr:hypothetical protein [Myxococcales bacterium]
MSGTFQTTYWTDDGTKTTVSALPTPTFGDFGPPALPSALLVPDSSASGYAKFPLSVDANQSFSVAGVPAGPYFLELDNNDTLPVRCAGPGGFSGAAPVVMPELFELSANVPDLVVVSSARPDLMRPTSIPGSNIALDISNLDPWATGDQIQLVSSQALTNFHAFLSPAPQTGAPSYTGTSFWIGDGLPDASKGDVLSIDQRVRSTLTSGTSTATLSKTTKFARLTNVTVPDGGTGNASAQLTEAPQTGAVTVDLRSSQFAALATDVHPTLATSQSGEVIVLAVPHSASYPDMPSTTITSLATVNVLSD